MSSWRGGCVLRKGQTREVIGRIERLHRSEGRRRAITYLKGDVVVERIGNGRERHLEGYCYSKVDGLLVIDLITV